MLVWIGAAVVLLLVYFMFIDKPSTPPPVSPNTPANTITGGVAPADSPAVSKPVTPGTTVEQAVVQIPAVPTPPAVVPVQVLPVESLPVAQPSIPSQPVPLPMPDPLPALPSLPSLPALPSLPSLPVLPIAQPSLPSLPSYTSPTPSPPPQISPPMTIAPPISLIEPPRVDCSDRYLKPVRAIRQALENRFTKYVTLTRETSGVSGDPDWRLVQISDIQMITLTNNGEGRYLTADDFQAVGYPQNFGLGTIGNALDDNRSTYISSRENPCETNFHQIVFELKVPLPVSDVVVYNRQDCCVSRLSGTRLQVLNENLELIHSALLGRLSSQWHQLDVW